MRTSVSYKVEQDGRMWTNAGKESKLGETQRCGAVRLLVLGSSGDSSCWDLLHKKIAWEAAWENDYGAVRSGAASVSVVRSIPLGIRGRWLLR